MLRRMLLATSASDRVRRMIVLSPYIRDLVARYVAGDDALAAVETTQRLLAAGLQVTLDHLGEDTTDSDRAAAVAAEYVALLARLDASGLTAGGRAEVSVKPTAVGLHLPQHGEKTAAGHIATICAAARDAGTTVTLDMEDHTHVDATLRLVGELREDYPNLGCVIQSQLRRSAADCAGLAYAGSRVRLCKGAYDPPEEVAFASRAQVDRSYVRCLRVLMRGAGYPMVATHDPRLIEIAVDQAERAGRPATSHEFQMLFGVRQAEQQRLASTGATVRVYVPYGADWYGYLMRRLAERPANIAVYLRSLATHG